MLETNSYLPWIQFVILILNTFMSFISMVYPPCAHFIKGIRHCKFCGSEISVNQVTPPHSNIETPIQHQVPTINTNQND